MTDIREALESAYEEADTSEESTETIETPEAEGNEAVSTTEDNGGDPDAPEMGGSEADRPTPVLDEAEPEVPGGSDTVPVDETPPPASWNAAEREFWNEATPKVREAIARRERDANEFMQRTAETRKFGEQMQQLMAPHQQMLQGAGSNPVQAVERMLGVAGGLVQGTPQQKAQMVSSLMQQYGVDVQELANVISGQTDPQQTQQADIARQVEQQVAQRMQPYQQVAQQQTQQAEHQIKQELANFAKDHEFYNDVREQMADVMDLYAQQGKSATLEQAYDMAVKINPNVQQVVAGRQQAQRADRAAAAGSPRPGGGVAPPQGNADTLRGNLLDAWDTLGSH